MKFQSAKEAMDALIARAHKDVDFRVKLIESPKETMRAFGIGLPENYDVVVNDQSQPNTFYINIPPSKK